MVPFTKGIPAVILSNQKKVIHATAMTKAIGKTADQLQATAAFGSRMQSGRPC